MMNKLNFFSAYLFPCKFFKTKILIVIIKRLENAMRNFKMML